MESPTFAIVAFIVPCLRIIFVKARVSIPEIPGIFFAFKNSSSVSWFRQLLARLAHSLTTTPLQVGLMDS